jgi:hypothetical protein
MGAYQTDLPMQALALLSLLTLACCRNVAAFLPG